MVSEADLSEPGGNTLKAADKVGQHFWEEAWRESPAGKYYGIEKYLAISRKLDRLFKRFIEKGNKRILEIGCARGKQLIYFAREFGYQIYGIDYSEKGVELAKENLKIAGVEGTILCQDIFQTTLKEESFDVVYSMGLIEHFENPLEIVDAHIKLLKKGGTLIITIPNYKDSLSFTLNKIMGKDGALLATHNLSIMDRESLGELLAGKGMKILTLSYFGPIDLTGAFSGIRVRPVLYLAHLLNQIVGYATFLIPGSPYFSPYLVPIARKLEV